MLIILLLMFILYFIVKNCNSYRNIIKKNKTLINKLHSLKDQQMIDLELLSLDKWAVSTENTWIKYLKSDYDREESLELQFEPRQVYKCHYTYTLIESPNKCNIIAVSEICSQDIGLNPTELNSPRLLKLLSGKEYIKGLDQPYCTIYGCYSYGQWFGQLGDGRAMALGEVKGKLSTYEIQLKGCGRSPFSRGFDGKAVLRSSVREFLASEAMHHLGVPTTRALALLETNEIVKRPWYGDTSSNRDPYSSKKSKFPPNILIPEPGAIVCRVSKSFLRLTHIDLHIQRSEFTELMEMVDFICLREYPHLLDINNSLKVNDCHGIRSIIDIGLPERYIQLYKEVTYNNANLVALWQSVGYVQGNMNSDNTLFAGRTIDYGPFGWLEKYDPFYQPFTSDPSGNFAYIRQPTAMGINMAVLGESFKTIIQQSCNYHKINDLDRYIEEINNIKEKLYEEYFFQIYNKIRSQKLGIQQFIQEIDGPLWSQLELLMYRSECDYIILFRLLSKVATCTDIESAYDLIKQSFYDSNKVKVSLDKSINNNIVNKGDWLEWIQNYHKRLQNDSFSKEERVTIQNKANPKYVLRNWMSVLAYEK